jgi:hypothetical protein
MKKVDEKFVQLRKECDFETMTRLLQGKASKDKVEDELSHQN